MERRGVPLSGPLGDRVDVARTERDRLSRASG
jgi:hypothetical protein